MLAVKLDDWKVCSCSPRSAPRSASFDGDDVAPIVWIFTNRTAEGCVTVHHSSPNGVKTAPPVRTAYPIGTVVTVRVLVQRAECRQFKAWTSRQQHLVGRYYGAALRPSRTTIRLPPDSEAGNNSAPTPSFVLEAYCPSDSSSDTPDSSEGFAAHGGLCSTCECSLWESRCRIVPSS